MPATTRYTRGEIWSVGQETATQLRRPAIQRYPLCKTSIIPGILDTQSNGRHHQISRASATAASAPPYRLPSLKRNCISRINSSRRRPRSAPTRGSCKGASSSPRFSRIGANHRAMRVQNRHSASKKNHPRACRPFPSVYSLTSEIMAPSLFRCFVLLPSSCRLLLLCPQQRNHLPPQFHHALQSTRRHPDNLLEQARHR